MHQQNIYHTRFYVLNTNTIELGDCVIPGSVDTVSFAFPTEVLSLVAFATLSVCAGGSILLAAAHVRVAVCYTSKL